MDIGRTDGVGGMGRIEGPHRPPRATPPATPDANRADRVDISAQAHLVSEALSLPAIRADRVDEVRKLVESGRFDMMDRLEGAVDRFLRENWDLLPTRLR